MNRTIRLISAFVLAGLAGLLAGKIAVQSSARETDSALAYSCGYLAREELLSSPAWRQSHPESDPCRAHRLTAIAHGFTTALDAYPEEPKP